MSGRDRTKNKRFAKFVRWAKVATFVLVVIGVIYIINRLEGIGC